jgi:hypothetical protein
MPQTKIRGTLANDLAILKVLWDKWQYPLSVALDPPPIRSDGSESPEEMKLYWEREKAKEKVEQEVRPTKRYNDFKKELPRFAVFVSYLNIKWPGNEAPPGCSPKKTMSEEDLWECADYFQNVLEKYPRPQ